MNPKDRSDSTVSGALGLALRDFVLEASEYEIDAALREEGESPETLLRRGAGAIQRALAVRHEGRPRPRIVFDPVFDPALPESAGDEDRPTIEEQENNLRFIGAEPDPNVAHAWWYGSHCFLATEKGLVEL